MSDTLLHDLVARDAIRRLLALYCDAVSRRDPDAISSLFTQDAVVTIADGADRIGPAEIVEGLRRAVSVFSYLHQKCDTGFIDIDGERASARVNILEVNRLGDSDSVTMICGVYEDDFRVDDGAWRFCRRRFTLQFRTVLAAREIEDFLAR
ncbi:MAG TPA: nuclear transport factor 2 family protein [Sphingobium sp.]|uniref:nuclear transport factor 2 family protein n=1 Tax=Sphingobium sp. TaxID=1912891 RepID=UPI002ED5F6DF